MRRTLTATAFVIAIVIVGDSTALRSQGSMEPPPRNLDEFDRMFNELSNGDRWGRDDQLGAQSRRARKGPSGGQPREVRIVGVARAQHNPIAESGLPDSTR